MIAELDNVSKTYGNQARPAVSGLSLQLSAAEIVVLVGPNGCGKTTTMEMLAGLRVPSSGAITIHGEPVRPGGRQRLLVGVQLQESGLPQGLKVKEAIAAVAVLYADPGPVSEVTSALGLTEYLSQSVDKLSGGWRRRLDVALACIGRPALLILDEPTSGLDPVARAELWDFLRKLRRDGTSILASTHDLSEAEAFADRLLVMHQGRVVLSGSVDEVLGQAGGEWRLRLSGPDAESLTVLTEFGLQPLTSGDGVTALGDKDTLVTAADQLEERRGAGEINFADLLRGPVRLEDVFAAVTAGRGEEREPVE